MKKYLVFLYAAMLFFAVSFSSSYSQTMNNVSNTTMSRNNQFGLKANLGFSNVNDNESGVGSRFAFNFGAVGTFYISQNMSFQLEGLYSKKGAESLDGVVFDFSYLDIPILLKKDLKENPTHPLDIYVGLQFSLNLGGTVKYNGQSAVADGLKDYDVGIVGGIDYGFTRNFLIEVRYNLGLTSATQTGILKNNSIMAGFIVYL